MKRIVPKSAFFCFCKAIMFFFHSRIDAACISSAFLCFAKLIDGVGEEATGKCTFCFIHLALHYYSKHFKQFYLWK